MADRELSTRDLGETPDRSDATDEPKLDASAEPGSKDAEAPMADDPLTRERTELDEETADEPARTAAVEPAEARADEETPHAAYGADDREPILPTDESDRLTTRWQEIQIAFVDEPRESVANADALVADLMQRLAASFANERQRLEAQWDRGDEVSTEDLRVALTRYRSFFDRLLSA